MSNIDEHNLKKVITLYPRSSKTISWRRECFNRTHITGDMNHVSAIMECAVYIGERKPLAIATLGSNRTDDTFHISTCQILHSTDVEHVVLHMFASRKRAEFFTTTAPFDTLIAFLDSHLKARHENNMMNLPILDSAKFIAKIRS
jgi:hypothetical protein